MAQRWKDESGFSYTDLLLVSGIDILLILVLSSDLLTVRETKSQQTCPLNLFVTLSYKTQNDGHTTLL